MLPQLSLPSQASSQPFRPNTFKDVSAPVSIVDPVSSTSSPPRIGRHPIAAGGHPRPSCAQHQRFFIPSHLELSPPDLQLND
jgi:hypothetical protein